MDTTRGGRWKRTLGRALGILFLAWLPACGGPVHVRLGVVLPLSGSDARCSLAVRDGVLLAHEQSGRTPEIEVELRVEDSRGDAGRAAELLSSLYDGGAVAALGGMEPEESLAMASVAETSRRVLLSPSPASLVTASGGVRQWFRLAPPAVQEGSALARFVGDTMGLDALVVASDPSPSATALRAVIERSMAARGVTVVDLPSFVSREAVETALVEAVRRSGAAAVLLIADSQSVSGAVRTLEGAGFDGMILTTSAFVVGDDAPEIAALARGIFVPLPVFDTAATEGSQGVFVEAFQRRYGRPPNLCAANGYDAMTMLLEALRRGGLTPAGVWKGLRSLRDFPGTRRSLQFDERGEILDFPRIHRIEGEALVDYEDWIEDRRVEIEAQIRRLQEQRLRLLEELGGG